MEELDGDVHRLSYRNQVAERDIVQVVIYSFLTLSLVVFTNTLRIEIICGTNFRDFLEFWPILRN